MERMFVIRDKISVTLVDNILGKDQRIQGYGIKVEIFWDSS